MHVLGLNFVINVHLKLTLFALKGKLIAIKFNDRMRDKQSR